MKEEQQLVAQLSVGAWRFALSEAVEVLNQILTCLHLVTRDDV